jgi:hypothetical protein
MPVDPRKRQKKQERRAAQRKAKQHQLSREKHAGLPERLSAAAKCPILHCWVTTDVWDQGIGWLCLSRLLPNGSVAFALFLVDRYCLGVKNVMAEIAGRYTYDTRIVQKTRSEFTVQEMQPAAARKFIEGAVAYARGFGIQPHPDYQKAKLLFGGIDPGECAETFEYGKDGKPFFVGGPNDTLERSRQIVRMLEQSCGPGGFDYLIPLGDVGGALPSLPGPEPRLIGPDEAGTFGEETDEPEDENPSGGPQAPPR